MRLPGCVEERLPLTARLDAIDLAIQNLCRVYGLGGEAQAEISFAKVERKRRGGRPKLVANPAVVDERRALLMKVIS